MGHKVIAKTSKISSQKNMSCGNKLWQAHRLEGVNQKKAIKPVKK